MNEKEQKLRELIVANPDLPVIFMVNSDVVVDDFYTNMKNVGYPGCNICLANEQTREIRKTIE